MIETGSGGAAALFKVYGFKVGIGMIAGALMYAVCPPVDKTGKFNRKEFVTRLAVAGIFSTFFGDLGVETLQHYLPAIQWAKHEGAVYLVVGAPGWWISRAAALYFHNRRDKDIGQIVQEVKQ